MKEVFLRNLIAGARRDTSLIEDVRSSTGVALPYDGDFDNASAVEGNLRENSNLPSMVWDLVDATDDASVPGSVLDAARFTFRRTVALNQVVRPRREQNGVNHPVVEDIGQYMAFSSSDFKDGNKRDEFGWFSDVYDREPQD